MQPSSGKLIPQKFTDMIINNGTVEPAYYGHLGTDKKCPDYQGVSILYDKVQFGTSTKCVDYAGVLIFKCSH